MPRRSKGFTLLEVLVAVAIIAIVLISLTGAISNYALKQQRLQARTVASWVADNLMLEARLQPGFPALGERKDSVEMARQTWYWRTTITATEEPDLRRIDVVVALDQELDHPVVSLAGYVGRQ